MSLFQTRIMEQMFLVDYHKQVVLYIQIQAELHRQVMGGMELRILQALVHRINIELVADLVELYHLINALAVVVFQIED